MDFRKTNILSAILIYFIVIEPIISRCSTCDEKDSEEEMNSATSMMTDALATIFTVFDQCFGWIFVSVDQFLSHHFDEVDVNQGPLDMLLEYIGVSDPLSAKAKSSFLQKTVCRHYKKVLTMIVVLLSSLLYVRFSTDNQYKPNLVESLYCDSLDDDCRFLPENCDDAQRNFQQCDNGKDH